MRKNKLLLLLVLLLTAATQAWATDVYLVGNGTGNWLNGVAWDPGEAGNKMTEQNGVYSITFTNVAANSEYQFKFSIDGSWGETYGCSSETANELNKTLSNIEGSGNNIMFGLTEAADVTISFNLSELTYMISTKGMKVGDDASSGPKHLITAKYREQTRSLEQPLPYATTIGELYEAVTGQSFSDLISSMSAVEMPLTGISSNNTSAVSIGELNGASTPVTVNAEGKATISINFGSYAYGIFVSVPSPLYAYMKDGVKDADKWTVKVGEGQAQALPIGGLKGDGSETVTLQYNGRLKVKGVKATSDAAPAGPPSWKLTLSSPAKDLYIIANGGVIAQQTLDVASTEFTVEMPELTSQTVNIFATDGSGNCWYCTQENMSFAIGQTYQSSPTMTALDGDNNKPLYKITATSDVTIPDGKTVVLSGVNISGGSITCDGSVTMILMGANTVTATDNNAAIKIGGPGTTLTITGSGSLTAQGGLEAAGIGTDRIEDGELSFGNIVINGGTVTATGGKEGAGIGTGLAQGEFYTTSITCGDITINGGTVTATGGLYGAGIGTGPTMSDGGSASITCGDITINGGTVTATGGGYGPGIGTGVFLKYGSESASNRCGAITIGAGVISVTATKGSSYSPNSIGKGYAYGGTQNFGTITIGGDATTYAAGVTASPFTYTPSN